MEVSFELTREDLGRFEAYQRRFDARLVATRRALRAAIGLAAGVGIAPVVALAGYGLAVWAEPDGVETGQVVSAVVCSAVWVLLWAGVALRAFMSRTDAAAAEMDPFAAGPRRVRLVPEGVWVHGSYGEALHRWPVVSLIDRTDDLVALHVRAPLIVVVPARAFADASEAGRFVEEARRLRAADGDAVDMVAALLAGRDVPCPLCGFNLRGQQGGKCPECGGFLELGHVRAVAGGKGRD